MDQLITALALLAAFVGPLLVWLTTGGRDKLRQARRRSRGLEAKDRARTKVEEATDEELAEMLVHPDRRNDGGL